MKLLMISSDSSIVEGKKGAFFNTLSHFHKYFDRIDIICPPVKNVNILSLLGNVSFHPLPLPTGALSKIVYPMYVYKSGQQIVSDHNPDLLTIHAYGLQQMSIGGLWLAQKTKIPFVVEIHHIEGYPKVAEPLDILRKFMVKKIINYTKNKALGFRVVNKGDSFDFLKNMGVPEDKLLLIYSMYINTKVFRDEGNTTKQYDLIFVGRLEANKGIPLLLETLKILTKSIPDIKLLILGKGSEEKKITILIEKLQLSGNVTMIKEVEKLEDVAVRYNQSKIVVCTSYAEGGPRFVVEAMSCGLPAISSSVGLMKEIIINGENGYIIDRREPIEYAEKIKLLLNNNKLYKKCSKNAIETVKPFEISTTIAKYANEYKRLIGKNFI